MKLKLLPVLFLICFFTNQASAEDNWVFLNFGLKLGFSSGLENDFVLGFEISVTSTLNDDHLGFAGVVLSFDATDKYKKFHLGVEAGPGYGIDIGPTFTTIEGETYTGFSVTPYIGFLLIPYFSYTYVNETIHIYEVGSFLKLPLMLRGDRFGFGG